MSAPLFAPPLTYTLPVSLDADIIVTFMNQTPGSDPPTYEDYPAGTTVSLVVGKVNAQGVIDGSNAVCRIPGATANTIKNGALWRCVVTLADPNGIDTDSFVPMNGPVMRSDGA